jgi:hypothetical protein
MQWKPVGGFWWQGGINSWLGPNIGGHGNPLVLNGDISPNTGLAKLTLGMDVRQQTEYGTLRVYTRAGFDCSAVDDANSQCRFYTERAFIQFAGFTLGKSQSFFDLWINAGYAAPNANLNTTVSPSTTVAGYTAQFGSGWSSTISLEDGTYRRNAIWDAGTNGLNLGFMPGPRPWFAAVGGTCSGPFAFVGPKKVDCEIGDYAAHQVPDIVGSLRVDQAWGSAQIAGALHQIKAGYYGNNGATSFIGSGGYTGVAPEDKTGFAVMGGVILNLPWATGDKFWIDGTYTRGAVTYTGLSQNGLFGNFQRFDGNTAAAGWGLDAIFANTIGSATPTAAGTVGAASGIQLTTAWALSAAIEHNWTPTWRTSLWATLNSVDFNGTATQIFCESPVGSVRTVAGATPNFATGAVIGCNPDFTVWGVGTRTIWNPVKNLDVGFEVMYTKLEQNMDPNTVRWNFGGGGRPAGLYVPANQDIWSGVMRLQRNFWP